MEPRQFLRIEGLASLSVALGIFFGWNGPLWLLAVLALAPDLSMIGYLGGPRIGSHTYNIVHTYTLPLAVGAGGYSFDIRMAVLVAAIWAGHIGADRLAGYGLKYSSGFSDTHLSRQPPPAALLDLKER